MEFLIRIAKKEDSEFIANLSTQLGYKSTVELISNRLIEILTDPSNCVFVALNGDQVIGWIHRFYSLRVESDLFVEIGGLIVDKNYRRKGIAKLLFAEVITWAHIKNVKKIRLRSNIIRIETHEFYIYFGFEEIKEQKIFDLKLN